MKSLNKMSIYGLASLFVLINLFSCSDDFPEALDSGSNFTVIKSIKIVSAGETGNGVVEGVVNEDTKEITFPRLDTLTNFQNLKFEAELSNGATLDKEVYPVTFLEGESEKTIVIKVQNLPRYREYLVKLRLKVPVYGADFSLPTVYDFSANKGPAAVYPAFAGQLTRGTGFDGKYVLIASRGTSGVHLLDVEKLKVNDKTPIPLSTTGVTGGTYSYNMAAQVNGHSYVASLSGAATSPLKLYHWASPTSTPEVVADINVAAIPGAAARHGDNFSIALDANGNGYAFFTSATSNIIRVKIENYNRSTEVSLISTATNYEQWSTVNLVGNTGTYIIGGHSKPISLIDASGKASHTFAVSTLPIGSADPRVINFNGERYLLTITIPRGAPNGINSVLRVYNITRGATINDAFVAFEQTEKKPVYEFLISGATNTAPGTQSGFYVVKDAKGKDQKLMIYGATTDAGFAIIEFPVNIAKD
ncbi:hypothetical protein Pedsa_1854 [Pseudopedobacter saltans DSM 12145]|uniref:DUF4623 domain-containing protein n=1 Tax=Pseudopedobacter saltans (strain ATCC 51119 / DSM 12145 / JCM 21818 / CCUG 39354 / LMG 10337 / NBRC 100064 / NCIMB 13643) TaxID=762903 RepID=F0S8S8_PSESL|nr:DUF4623 domain-containing protein [Pseudopedobacter saltans]ADY52409.1 hypothetical protein Pedsa_1854 [Pseudopedobacter saltans DSM 12145]